MNDVRLNLNVTEALRKKVDQMQTWLDRPSASAVCREALEYYWQSVMSVKSGGMITVTRDIGYPETSVLEGEGFGKLRT